MLEIFNIIISGDAVEHYLSLSKEDKKEFIKNHTNQKNDSVIDDFLSMNNEPFNGCVNCGELNNKIENPFKNGNISEGIPAEAIESEQPKLDGTDGGADSNERPKKSKRAKRN